MVKSEEWKTTAGTLFDAYLYYFVEGKISKETTHTHKKRKKKCVGKRVENENRFLRVNIHCIPPPSSPDKRAERHIHARAKRAEIVFLGREWVAAVRRRGLLIPESRCTLQTGRSSIGVVVTRTNRHASSKMAACQSFPVSHLSDGVMRSRGSSATRAAARRVSHVRRRFARQERQ